MKKEIYYILVINPGSTSTKIGIFSNEKLIFEKNIEHSNLQLEAFPKIWEQYDFRKNVILKMIEKEKFDIRKLSCVVGRGGLLLPVVGGTYKVNQKMIEDLRKNIRGEHASNLGAVLAFGIAWDLEIQSFIVDPPVVDELEPLARYSGISEIERESIFHALNIKAVSRIAAKNLKKKIEDVNLIVAHIGGGITVASLKKGKIVDLNNALHEGPFTPERAGSLPTVPLVEMCYSGKYEIKDIKKKLIGKGGLVSYLGTNKARQVEEMIETGNSKARTVYEAMAYQISKEIGSQSSVLMGEIDAVVLTGGIANSKLLTGWIKERTSFLSKKFFIIPGENELEALCLGALRVLRGEEPPKEYGSSKKYVGIIFWELINEYQIAIDELEKSLISAGYRFRVQDENIELIYKNCKEKEENLIQYLNMFMEQKVDLIYCVGSPLIPFIKRMVMGKDIPVVCAASFDPIVMGIAKSYQSSENNITGTSYRVSVKDQLTGGLLKLLPNLRKIGIIYKFGEINSEHQYDDMRSAVNELGLELISYDAQGLQKTPEIIHYFKQKGVEAVFLPADLNFSLAKRKQITEISYVFPTLCALRSSVIKGGLLSYCANFQASCYQAAMKAVKILQGAKPSDLPFDRSTSQQLIINMRTAEELKIKIPEKIKKISELII